MNKLLHNNYIFFDTSPALWRLTHSMREKRINDFVKIVRAGKALTVYGYSVLGLKAGMSFMLWIRAERVDEAQNLVAQLMHSSLAEYLKISYTLFGVERTSVYVGARTAQDQAINTHDRTRYLIIYPFTKTMDWYFLSMETRRKMMGGHILVGRQHPKIRQLLLYSYGLDDHEFIVSYETEELEEFQSLVIDLRATEVRKYTLRDTPIFTCIHKPFEKLF